MARKKYKVVTLCGSTRFQEDFERIQRELTLDGNVVISVGVFGHGRDERFFTSLDSDEKASIKGLLDDIHLQKIDMAQEIAVVNPGGYIGESTWEEVVYAAMTLKGISSIEPIDQDEVMGRWGLFWRAAEALAKRQLDALHHSYDGNSSGFVTLRHKGQTIVDPWLSPEDQIVPFAWQMHDNPQMKIDPFEVYGRKAMARFVIEAWRSIMERERISDKTQYGEVIEWLEQVELEYSGYEAK